MFEQFVRTLPGIKLFTLSLRVDNIKVRRLKLGREKIAPRSVADDALKTLGAQIRASRVRQRWTQKRLAAVIHASERTVSLIERGDPAVSIGNVFNAAAATGVPLFQEEGGGSLSEIRQHYEGIAALIPQRVTEVQEVSRELRDF